MGKGSGGGGVSSQPSKSTVTQSNLPEYARPYYERLLDRGETESETPYDAYGGSRIADFNPTQQSGFDMSVASATEAPTGMMDAKDYYSGIMNKRYGGRPFRYASPGGIGEAGPARTGLFGGKGGGSRGPRAFEAQDYMSQVGEYDPSSDYQQYMDPYLEDVLGRQRTRAEDIFQQQAGKREDARVGRGTRRGSRAAVEEAMARDTFEQRMGDLESQQRSQGYLKAQEQARDQFLKDRASRIQATQLGGAERLSEARYGMDAAAAAAGIDPLLFKQQQDQAGALQAVGGAEQKMEQANKDLAYQDFLNQRDFDRRQLQFLAGLLQGVPVTPQSEVYQYQAPASFGGQVAGAGLGAAGLYKMLTG